jgi:toxin ParE1/3/4
MSAPRLPIKLSPEAWDDLDDIAAYGLLTWGDAQRDRYLATLDRALLSLGENPRLGRARDDLRRGYRSLVAGQHAIIYEITTDAIQVVRILHSRMDFQRALRDDP